MMKNKTNVEKVEIANKIAKQSKRVSKTYELFETWIIRTFRVLSSYIDKWIFNSKYLLIISLFLSLLLYLSTNYSGENSILTSPLNNEKTMPNVEVHALYNSETFELSGLPKNMDLRLIGTASNVIAASNKQGRIIADLNGYTEGTHIIELKTEGYGNLVDSLPVEKKITLTLKKKTTRSFPIEYDFINQNKLGEMYVLSEPVFEISSVLVRGSQDTLDSIAFIKVLIDVKGKKESFVQEAPLIAYDVNGIPIDADILPNTVKVNVEIKTPSNTVPIIMETTGKLSEGLSLENIVMDHNTIQIFAPENILSDIEYIPVQLDLSTISENTEIFVPIIFPNSVSSPVSRVNLTVTLNEKVSKQIDDVVINYRNNINNYDELLTSITTVSVTVYGTKENLDKIDASSIDVYFDMKDAIKGTTADYPLIVENVNKQSFVEIVPNTSTITVTIKDDSKEGDD